MALRLGDIAPNFEVSVRSPAVLPPHTLLPLASLVSPSDTPLLFQVLRARARFASLHFADACTLDLQAETTIGKINFHEYINNSWAILFSHPDDYTPVCTTELSAVSISHADFESRGVKMIGLSANNVDSHAGWVKDIDNLVPGSASLNFPIIGDESREIANLYGMLDKQDLTNVDKKGMAMTIRVVFISEPDFSPLFDTSIFFSSLVREPGARRCRALPSSHDTLRVIPRPCFVGRIEGQPFSCEFLLPLARIHVSNPRTLSNPFQPMWLFLLHLRVC